MRAEMAVILPVPELGPSLGRLIVPHRLNDPWVPLDDVREALATRVMECAGAARRDAADAAPARALRQLDRDAWSEAWNEAVRRAAERVALGLEATMAFEARRVRMPAHRAKALALSAAERRAITARLGSGAEGFEAALEDVARATDELHRDWPGDSETVTGWRAAQELAARRLESAWLALETLVDQERARWAPKLEAIRSWRPSLLPVLAVWLPAAGVLVWLALVIGGYLPAPEWLAAALGF